MKEKIFHLLIMLIWHRYPAETQDDQKFRLPNNLEPKTYDLVMYTDLNNPFPKYWGTVRITVDCTVSTNIIILNSKDLEIIRRDVTVKLISDGSEKFVIILNQTQVEENDQYIIELIGRLEAKKTYEIKIDFKKNMLEDFFGYFLKKYKDGVTGQERKLTATRLRPFGARQVFPCMDQINMKAKFKISLAHPDNVFGFSNADTATKHEPIENMPHWVMDTFEETVPMSTYQLAIVLADLQSKELRDPSTQVPIRIWANQPRIDQVELAHTLDRALEAFQLFSTLFKVPYALPKLDIVVLPKYFVKDEEDYGLITLGFSSLKNTNEISKDLEEFLFLLDICGELIQQWVGTHVTMSWWNEYWFHDGLTIFYETLCVNKLVPEWTNTFSEVHTGITFIEVLSNDVEPMSKPLLVHVEKIYFNSKYSFKYSSGKASLLIRMMNFMLGDHLFERSITNYLKKFEFKNSSLDEVWEVFTDTANEAKSLPIGMTVKEIMQSWISQSRFPLITVTKNTDGKGVTVSQQRFTLLEEENEDESKNTCWTIPLAYTTKKDLNFDSNNVHEWLTCDGSKTIEIALNDADWIIFNPKFNVLGRTNYDEKNWLLLQETLLDENEYSKIEGMTRTRLISDMFALSKAGLLQYKIVFDTIPYLKYEKLYLPWKIVLDELSDIRGYVLGTDLFKSFQKYFRKILEPVFSSTLFQKIDDLPTENKLKRRLKISVIATMCVLEFESCRKQSEDLFMKWLNNPNQTENPIDRDIQKIVYCEVIKRGDNEKWKFLWTQYKNSTYWKREYNILEALGCSPHVETLKSYLQSSIEKSEFPLDNKMIFLSLSSNQYGYTLMKEFFTNNVEKIKNLYTEDDESIGFFLGTLFENTSKMEDLKELKDFLDRESIKETLKKSKDLLDKSIIKATRNVLWLQKNTKTLTEIFKD